MTLESIVAIAAPVTPIFKGNIKMSKIKISALGGVGENGKNMYIVEVDERIFILDSGLKYPTIDMYGIDAIVPTIDYLIENN